MFRLLIFCLIGVNFSLSANPNYIPNDLPLARSRAANEGKLLVVEFGAKWCAPCKLMEEFTWTSQNVVAFCDENCIVSFLDVDDAEGNQFSKTYKVKNLPTIIVFNAKGEKVGRIENSMSASKLLDFLTPFNSPENKTARIEQESLMADLYPEAVDPNEVQVSTLGFATKPAPQESTAFASLFSESGHAVVSAETMDTYKEKVNLAPQFASNVDEDLAVATPTKQLLCHQTEEMAEREQLYEVAKPRLVSQVKLSKPVARKIEHVEESFTENVFIDEPSMVVSAPMLATAPKKSEAALGAYVSRSSMFTVQIGAFRDLNNAIRIQKQVIHSVNQSTTIEMPKSNSDGLYRVIVGNFKNEAEAEAMLVELTKISNEEIFIRPL